MLSFNSPNVLFNSSNVSIVSVYVSAINLSLKVSDSVSPGLFLIPVSRYNSSTIRKKID